MVTRYLGGFIGDEKSKRDWLKYRTSKWEKNICAITKMLGEYPQESYVAVVCVIQPEWIFLQRVKKDTGCAILGVEKILQENLLPCLFFGKSKYLPPIIGTLSMMTVKRAGLGLQDPVISANNK